MTEVKVHLLDGHTKDIHFNGEKEGTPINAFLLLTSIPTNPPTSHILVYGNSETVGQMLFSFWKNSIEKDPVGAWVLEQVAKDIVKAADEARGEWPEEVTDMLM